MPAYKVYFPDRGETISVSRTIVAKDAQEAAEKAAAKICNDDVEWDDHLVAVAPSRTALETRFDVQVESRPHFTAIRIK